MRHRISGVGALAFLLVVGRRASADPDGDPSSGTATSMIDAQRELDEGAEALAAGDCVTMCKSLRSMARAAQRICALSEAGTDADRQRCTEARTRVEEATKRVLAACPGCDPSPPYAPSTAPPTEATTKPIPVLPGMSSDMLTTKAAQAGSYEAGRWVPARRFSIVGAPFALFLPASMVRLGLETRVVDHLSLGVSLGVGRLATEGGDGHAPVVTFGATMRGYLLSAFDGLYLGADLRLARPSLEEAERLATRAVIPGLTVGPTLGYKLVTPGGFTVDTGFGFAFVVADRRREGQSTERVVPTWDVGIGYSF